MSGGGTIGDRLALTRDDMRAWPGDTQDLIMQVQREGWSAYRTNNHHIKLLAPDGVTVLGVSTNKDSYRYTSEKVRKYKREHPTAAPAQPAKARPTQKWPCPRPGCNKVYDTLDHLDLHIAVDHENLVKCPDCSYTHRLDRIVKIHRSKVHGYESPSKAGRLAAERKRAAKKNVVQLAQTQVDELKAIAEEIIAEVVPITVEEVVETVVQRTTFEIEMERFSEQRAEEFSVEIMDEDEILSIPTPAKVTRPLLKIERKDIVNAQLRELRKRGRDLALQLKRLELEAQLLELQLEEIDAE